MPKFEQSAWLVGATWVAASALVYFQLPRRDPPAVVRAEREIPVALVRNINAHFSKRWQRLGVEPEEAPPLKVLRRLSLSLQGTVPSLEEIRAFESDGRPNRLAFWTKRILESPRFTRYFAERLARVFVGTEGGPFVIYRRDHFVRWLDEALVKNLPYDEMVRALIAQNGLWTDRPASNFVTAQMQGDKPEVKLAGRSVRAFLGHRIDCAECHDHPFEDWKQSDFEGLAAFFGQAKVTALGVQDDVEAQYLISSDGEERVALPQVPFGAEWFVPEGTKREQFSSWLTHPENRRFERATVNRVWGLLFGRPYITPVDDLPAPPATPDILDILGRDFRENGYDLKRLILGLSMSRPFRIASSGQGDAAGEAGTDSWWRFPLTRLRPEQIIGAMLQVASVETINPKTHVAARAIRYLRAQDFVKGYGDVATEELEERSGTISQALLRMNGKLPNELIEGNPFTAVGRILGFTRSDEDCVATSFLAALSRLPSAAEMEHFGLQLKDSVGDARQAIAEDMFWALLNSPEFSWNH